MMNKKIGYACLIGAPNSGKSTLLNALVNQKISAVTHKVHTTRDNIKGIVSKDNAQLIFIDTPGYLKNPKYKLEKSITKKSLQEIKNVDFICIIVDVAKKNCLNNPLIDVTYFNSQENLIIIFNKVDLVKDKNQLLLLAQEAKAKGFNNIFMISAINNKGVTDFLNYLITNSPEGEWHYNEDEVTDRSIKQIAEDITMEQLYKFLNKEIPYNLKVETESWKETQNDITIHQVITVLKDSQKKIILGTNGENIKKISIISKREIEKLTDKKIHLYLFIKVRDTWMDKL
ncbi:GTPase Era [Candidatus Bandiella numerosa]|uniref:GTPase Era n=1 Tax=Candidatus Bandiella numerosa TaxID=2570586 RepID=UPI00249DCAE2|nr:GTPase Era [Candidatus Bandiella numerosa]WHA05094.1 GTPase Era [Candidatus Bandiella numerosa]